ncbi:dihydrofolate reductase family protein [Corynebacterium sp. TA-R-1]|uniref:Dihydrofolate reductase family protein n=1 Tax=Corynebacterium stercoris TaxID=2943490 RepID=A0ABT1FZL2_9CORY|nr:dihydrofolate reductase family protein [Corynebacterium stercoris]MCP1387201.1 dihydrofolate reductase family protein [Corynebacterium stercoris]
MHTAATPVDTAALLGPVLPAGEPELRAIAVNALFGAFGREGTSEALGNDTDAALIRELRGWADVILVGAGTVEAEDYGPADTPMAVLSTSLDLDPGLGIFHGARLIVLTPEQSLTDDSLAANRTALEAAGAELVSSFGGTIREAVEALRREGYARILCEGGPGVYADVFAADLVDVLHLTIDPSLSPADAPSGLELDGPADGVARFAFEDVTVEHNAMMFCRLRRVADVGTRVPRYG